MSSAIRERACAWILAGLGLLIPCASEAGTGTFRQVQGQKVLDFCVSVRFNATPQQIGLIEDAFNYGSEILGDATDGQVGFGRISIINNSGASSEAEVWIHPGSNRANATLGLYGKRGEHINLYYGANIDEGPNIPAESYAYTIAHEFAHHVWGVADEYSGPIGCCSPTSTSPCPPMANICDCEIFPGDMSTNYCLMDNYFRRGGNIGSDWSVDPPMFGTFTLNEMCVHDNHDDDGDTWQDVINGESCWETIAAHPLRALTPPANLPVSAAPDMLDPEYIDLVAESRFAIVLDRSGSMSAMDVGDTATRLHRAIQAAHIFINLAETGDKLGIVSFSSGVTTEYGLNDMDDNTKQDAKDSMNLLMPGGNTAIGLALDEAMGMIAPLADSCNQPIVLCTDGFGNTGPSAVSFIPTLVDNRIPVTVVAIGGEVNEVNMMKLASETGGKYWRVDSAEDLPPIYSFISADVGGKSVITTQSDNIPDPGRGAPFEYDIPVEGGATEVTFVLSWSEQNANLSLLIEAPNGQIFTKSVAIATPGVDVYDGSSQEVFRFNASSGVPLVGLWTVRVLQEAPGGTQFSLVTISDADQYDLTLATDKPIYDCGDTIKVLATPQYEGRAVTGATVSAAFTTPGGTSGTLTLRDDGGPASGDDQANDGVYTALLGSAAGPGTYGFDVMVESTGGMTAAGESMFEEAGHPSNPLATPPFMRTNEVYAVVACQGVPGDCDGDGDVSLGDFISFGRCLTGPLPGLMQSGCECSDLDDDYDVDLEDYQLFQEALP